jgi:hypothetical protein
MYADNIVDQEFKDQVFDDTNTKFKDFENFTSIYCDFRQFKSL